MKYPNSFTYAMLKLEVDTSLEKLSLKSGQIKLYCVWSNIVSLNEIHTMILVCAADDFRKYGKMQKLRFKKNHIKICHKQKIKCLVFFKSARQVCNYLNFNSIKTALKRLIY